MGNFTQAVYEQLAQEALKELGLELTLEELKALVAKCKNEKQTQKLTKSFTNLNEVTIDATSSVLSLKNALATIEDQELNGNWNWLEFHDEITNSITNVDPQYDIYYTYSLDDAEIIYKNWHAAVSKTKPTVNLSYQDELRIITKRSTAQQLFDASCMRVVEDEARPKLITPEEFLERVKSSTAKIKLNN